MTNDELEHYADRLEVELSALRSLVVALIVRLDTFTPGILDDIIGGLSGTSSAVLGDHFLVEQGSRAQMFSVAYDDLCNRLSVHKDSNP